MGTFILVIGFTLRFTCANYKLLFVGRGFDHVGCHTNGYNTESIGIAFIGCFMTMLPPKVSLDLCKLLIQKGVDEGHIAKNYKLVAHCQVTTTESPGKMLFDVIKTWPNWSEDP